MVEAHDKRQSVHPQPQITPTGRRATSAPVKKGKASTSRGDSDITSRLEAIRERRKSLEKKLAESPWGKGKGKGPAREVEWLKPLPGWEDWAQGKKLRRRLDYDSYQMKTCSKKKPSPRRRGTKRKRTQRGWGVDIQKWLANTGIEFHWPGYQYMGPGTHLAKRLKRGDPGINRLDKIAKQHDIDCSHAKNLQDKWKADTKMIKAIDCLPGKKTMTERVVKRIMKAKKRLKL